MKRAIIVCFLYQICIYANAQITLSGRVMGADSLAVSYATIFVKKTGTGCLSDSSGYFSLHLPGHVNTVNIQALGYKSVDIPVKEGDQYLTIYLDIEQVQLKEVVIKPGKFKSSSLVIKPGKKSKGELKACSEYAYQCGLYFPNEAHTAGEIQKIGVWLENEYLENAIFRLRVYTVDNTFKPDEDLLLENVLIYLPRSNRTSLKEIDVSPYGISIPENGVVIAVEWLKLPENKYSYTYTYNKKEVVKQCFGPVLKLCATPDNRFIMWSKKEDGGWFSDAFRTNFLKKKEHWSLVPYIQMTIREYD